jgi:hypothetical protein
MEPWVWAMQDADEAERRGDAEGALAVVRRRPVGPGGTTFWRPARMFRLHQLVALGEQTPGWAVSRWILEQAHQNVPEHETGRSASSRRNRAVRVVDQLHGPAGARPACSGQSDDAHRVAHLADHDWVYRQVHLFELGGLEAFLAGSASPDLVARADRIREWVRAPMGGYTFLGSTGESSLWLDRADQSMVTTPNIGSGFHLSPGSAVIGRLVPAADGVIFESRPLAVPGALALQVAQDPSRWSDLLRESGLVRDGTVPTDVVEWTGLLSDVPLSVTGLVLSYRLGEQRLVQPSDAHELVAAVVRLARELVEAEDPEPCLRCEDDPDDDCPDCFDDDWDGAAHLHAAVLDPSVLLALPLVLGGLDEADQVVLREACDLVAEPAATWLASLLDAHDAAA